MPRGAPLPDIARLYLGALDVALDPAVSLEGRAGAGRFMRDIADEVKARRPARAAITEYRYDLEVAAGRGTRRDRANRSDPGLRLAVPVALDHRICGES